MVIEEVQTSEGWDAFVAGSGYGDVLQSWGWGEVKRSEVWAARRVRVREGEQTMGVAQVMVRSLPMGRQLYYVPRGPVLDYTSPQATEILGLMVEWLKTEAVKSGGVLIKLGPAVPADETGDSVLKMLEGLGLKRCRKSVQAQHTRVVDLSRSEGDIFGSFDKDTRNLVRRAAREGVIVDKFVDPEEQKGLRFFHNMYTMTADRAKFSARPWGHFVKLWRTLAKTEQAMIYVASFEETPLASSLVLRLGDKAYQLYGSSRRDEAKKYAPYALQWTIIQDLKAQGVTSYDLWGVAPDENPAHPWAGITLFKKGFGGRQVDFIGDFDLPVPPWGWLYPLVDKLATRRL